MKVNARKRGKYWQYYFEAAKIDGKRKRVIKGGFKTKKEALEAGTRAKAEYDISWQITKLPDISVHDFMCEWFEKKAKIQYKSATLRKYESIINNHINKDLGKFKLKSLTPIQLQDYINYKYLEEDYSKSHIAHLMSCLNLAFTYAILPCGYIKNNPMLYVKIPRKDQEETPKKIVSFQEIETILNYFSLKGLEEIKLVWEVGYYTGLRRSEVIALSWDDIDFKNNYINVTHTQSVGLKSKDILNSPKTVSSKRSILVVDSLMKKLKKWKKKQKENKLYYGEFYINNYVDEKGIINHENGNTYDFVFRKENGRALVSSDIGRSMKMIKKDLNLPIKFHDLRHTHATILIENGAPLKAIQARLGHSKLDTTFNIYLHSTPAMEKEIIDILENIK